jgi:hypothetical protein
MATTAKQPKYNQDIYAAEFCTTCAEKITDKDAIKIMDNWCSHKGWCNWCGNYGNTYDLRTHRGSHDKNEEYILNIVFRKIGRMTTNSPRLEPKLEDLEWLPEGHPTTTTLGKTLDLAEQKALAALRLKEDDDQCNSGQYYMMCETCQRMYHEKVKACVPRHDNHCSWCGSQGGHLFAISHLTDWQIDFPEVPYPEWDNGERQPLVRVT